MTLLRDCKISQVSISYHGVLGEQDNSMYVTPPSRNTMMRPPRDIYKLAQEFKQQRKRLGHSQTEVGIKLGKYYGRSLSHTTISRIENMKMTEDRFRDWEASVLRWMKETRKEQPKRKAYGSASPGGKSREKIKISKTTRALLEGFFYKNRKPEGNEIQYIMDLTGMEKRNIQVWFNNRRQRDKISTMKKEQQQQQFPIDYSINSKRNC